MRATDLLRGLSRELDAFRACLDADLSTPIEHCGDWTLHDLADHLGVQNLWAAAAVTQRHGDYRALPAPREAASAWPIVDLTEPMAQNCRSLVYLWKPAVSARSSIRSPSGDPLAADST